ncbi:MAG: M48 family metalloprotease [Alcanivoracaceae bacterium]|nr:M48 family metalloprotease [Alcanivoracaceae bacterium]
MDKVTVLLLLFCPLLIATTDEQMLIDWTNDAELHLTQKYKIIQSDWFEEECLLLAKEMEFNKVYQCTLFDSPYINAYVFNNGHVYFSYAMMQLIKNKHQWASILAHENAHLELQHYIKMLKKINKPSLFFSKTKIKKILKKHEKEADQWSATTLTRFGYNPKQIFYFLQRVKNIKSSKKRSTHLKLSDRTKKPDTVEIVDQILIKNINIAALPISNKPINL